MGLKKDQTSANSSLEASAEHVDHAVDVAPGSRGGSSPPVLCRALPSLYVTSDPVTKL